MSSKSVEFTPKGAPGAKEPAIALLALAIDREVLEPLEKRASEQGLETVQHALIETLKRFGPLDPKEDVLLITGEDLKVLREYVGKIASVDELLRACRRGATVGLKGAASQIHVGLTPAQKNRVKDYAKGWKCEEWQALQRVIKESLQEKLGPF